MHNLAVPFSSLSLGHELTGETHILPLPSKTQSALHRREAGPARALTVGLSLLNNRIQYKEPSCPHYDYEDAPHSLKPTSSVSKAMF